MTPQTSRPVARFAVVAEVMALRRAEGGLIIVAYSGDW